MVGCTLSLSPIAVPLMALFRPFRPIAKSRTCKLVVLKGGAGEGHLHPASVSGKYEGSLP